jgi:hypothetical protein
MLRLPDQRQRIAADRDIPRGLPVVRPIDMRHRGTGGRDAAIRRMRDTGQQGC